MISIGDIEKARDSFSKFKGKKFRENQAEVIKFAMNSNKNIIILEAPCGMGKSLIGAICCKLAGDSTYLVHSKTLQQQIMEDFPEFTILMGKNNYPCLNTVGVSCADCAFLDPSKCINFGNEVCSRLIGEDGKMDKCVGKNACKGYLPACDFYDHCLYIAQKKKALMSKLRVLNYVYFLLEANYVGGFSGNSLIVCDEADVLEKELLGFIQFSISENMIKKYGVGIPRYKTATAKHGITSWKLWAKEIVSKINIEYKEKITLETLTKKEDEYYSGTLNKLNNFIHAVDESWIYDVVNPDSMNPYHTFKPVWISSTMTSDLLRRHGKKLILMSATFPDLSSISKTLGIPIKDMDYMEVPSNFKIENRPIYINPVAKINSKVTEEEINKLLNRVREIIEIHQDHKGLIHTSNYRLAYKIKEISPRMMVHNTETRMDVLEEFRNSDKPVILVSPSMERGISLPDDMARFMILAKCPFLDLNDKQISTRLYSSYSGQMWYKNLTAQTIEQMCGRANRHKDDSCEIYLLDEYIKELIMKHPRMFSRYFKDCLIT